MQGLIAAGAFTVAHLLFPQPSPHGSTLVEVARKPVFAHMGSKRTAHAATRFVNALSRAVLDAFSSINEEKRGKCTGWPNL